MLEVVVSIAILGIVTVPVCTGLLMSYRINARTDSVMRAQLAVTSAAETLMSQGIDPDDDKIGSSFENVEVSIVGEETNGTYPVKLQSTEEATVSVTTYIFSQKGGGGR